MTWIKKGLVALSLSLLCAGSVWALDGNDIVNMKKNGVDDTVIINMVQAQKLDRPLTPNEVLILNSSGTSSTLLEFLTRPEAVSSSYARTPTVVTSTTPAPVTVVEQPPTVVTTQPSVVVTQPQTVYYETPTYVYPYRTYGSPYYYPYSYPYSYRSGPSYSFGFWYGGGGHRGGPRGGPPPRGGGPRGGPPRHR